LFVTVFHYQVSWKLALAVWLISESADIGAYQLAVAGDADDSHRSPFESTFSRSTHFALLFDLRLYIRNPTVRLM
jgi:hypothetical protein